ncbi:hypothetical protein SDC9_116729 [bioreactor metagenome]|uniref:Phage head-tail joining protein n=1 Tax=bioreactor metagenome TaxID=1076179 RepID=A0A645BYP6_9ZZZZ
MITGRLNKRIILKQPVKTPDGRGGYSTVWQDMGTVWAEFRKPSLQTAETTGTIVSELIREISIRFRTDIRKGWRVVYGGKIFSVEHPPYDYGRETTVLVCKEVVK